jgi:PAS domain S-box-containing protein
MQRPQTEPATLEDIVITEELSRRNPRPANLLEENQALHALARQLVSQPQTMLQSLVDIALKLCIAGTVGVSLIETTPTGEEVFRAHVLAGTLKQYVGGTTPRKFSPCGVCLERGTPQLYSYPERYFTYLQSAKTPIVEELVLPFQADNHALGTIWIMSHDEQRHFDSEDVRVMTSLADFAAATLLLNQRQTHQLLAANVRLEAEVKERQRIERDSQQTAAALRESEEFLRAMVEHLPGGAVFVVDRNLRYLLAEGEALAIAGFKREDFVGRTIFEVLPSQLATYYEPMYRQALAGEGFEHEHNAHDRTYISRGTPLRADSGEIYAVLAVSYDITERKRTEVALRESEERLSLFVTASSDIVYRMSADWREMLSLTGKNFLVNTDNPRSTWIETYIPPEEQPRVWAAIQNAICTQSKFELEHQVIGQDGAIAWTLSRAIPMVNEQGDIVEWFGTASDVTERKRAEAALRESETKYRSLFESIDEAYAVVEVMTGENGEWNDFLFLEVNPAFVKQIGMEYPVGRKATELLGTPHSKWAQIYGRVAETGEPIRFEEGEATLGRVFDLYVFRLSGEDRRRVAVLFTDITDRKRTEKTLRESEARQAFLLQMSDALRSLADAVEIQEAVTRTAMNHFGADWCYYCEIEDGNAIIRRDATREGLPSVAGVYPLSRFAILQAVIDAGHPFVVQDVHTTDTVDEDLRQLCIQMQVISYINVPVIKNGKPLGVLCLVQSTPRDWTDLEVELVIETADRTWAAVERARAEVALRESEVQYRSLFTTMDQGFCIIEKVETLEGQPSDFRYLTVNPAFERHTGMHNVVGRTIREFVPDVEQHIMDIYDEVVRTGQPQQFEDYVSALDLWIAADVFPAQQPGQIAVLFSNISERQRAESLAELDRTKTLFFSNVSHEFRTPLTLSLAPLQDALSDSANPLPGVQRERLKLVHRNTLRLLKLVNTLLDFSRIEAGRMEAVYEPTDLALYTTELAGVFRSAIEQAGLRLVVDCPPLAESVYVDRQMWEKIVLNLLSNAFKFTFDGEIAVRLHLVDGHHVTLQVQDTGIGIEPEQLPYIMKRFYQVRAAKARTHEGSGIGLALVHELIKLHGGTIDVTSTPGVGSCFTVTIPLGTAHLPTESIQARRTLASTALGATPYVQEAERWIPEEREEGGEREETPHPPHTPAHILIVDDNADMRDYLRRILSEHHEVIAVADGAAALAAVNQKVPDLVVSDVMMPELDGFGLLKALRADARTKETPIILLSARAGEESIVEGLVAGADDYLIKPFSANELVTRVNAYLHMANMRSQALQQERTINRRKDEVLSVVSHELNTPLVAILGWTRLLRSNPPSPAMLSKGLEIIERNATLQAKLVEDLLDISRITAGKISLNLEPVQLQGVIENAIATVQQSLKTKEIHLQYQLEPAPVKVQGDPHRLQQIILNLLTNAVKFTPNGGSIEVSLARDENQAQLVISDTGCGIDAEFLPFIFDTFRQAPSTRKGLGLGLAIAHSLVQLHGGTIQAQSPGIGQGATFIVKLPLI